MHIVSKEGKACDYLYGQLHCFKTSQFTPQNSQKINKFNCKSKLLLL